MSAHNNGINLTRKKLLAFSIGDCPRRLCWSLALTAHVIGAKRANDRAQKLKIEA